MMTKIMYRKVNLVFHRPTREEAIAIVAQFNLQEEIELAIDELGMHPLVALKEWNEAASNLTHYEVWGY